MAQEIIQKKDKKKAEEEANAEAKMLAKIKKREEEKLHKEGVIARRCEQRQRKILLDLDPDDIGAGVFYIPIPDRETEAKLATLEGIHQSFPSSPPNALDNSWLNDDMVPLDIEGDIADASDVEDSEDDPFHV
jgi:hypothetical protein